MPFLIALVAIAGLLTLRSFDPAYLRAQRLAGFDTLQQIWPRQKGDVEYVRIVDIDEKSLKALGQWPWPRDQIASLTRNLTQLGAAAIAFDIVFPEPDRLSPRRLAENPAYAPYFASAQPLPDTDQLLAEALAASPSVLAFAKGQQRPASTLPLKSSIAFTGEPVVGAAPTFKSITGNIEALETAATGLGTMDIDLAGEQGIARAIPMFWSDGERLLPALSIEALRVAQGADAIVVHGNSESPNIIEGVNVGALEVPVSESGFFQVHFRPQDPALYVSASDVMAPEFQESLRSKIEGHIVLIGTSATGLLDTRITPLAETVPGVSVHAQAIEQILAGRFLSRPDWLADAEVFAALLLSLATAALAAFNRPATALVTGLTCTLGILTATGTGFHTYGYLVDASFPLLLLLGSFLASIAWRLFVTDRQGRVMRNVFGHYVAPSVLNEIERNPEGLKLGGEVRDVTVLFLDIANFTPLSEKLKPVELVSVVNGLWDACTKCILAEQGTIDKFIGDAVMAFWNAPLPCDGHQARACKAALAMREAVNAYNHLPEVRTKLESIGAWPLGIRIGIATGPACVGNMGSSDRFDYSVIGETVNTAARAEAACKQVGHDIVVAGETSAETLALAHLPAGRIQLKGHSAPQTITAIIGREDIAASGSFLELKRDLDILVNSKTRKSAKSELFKELAIHHPTATRFLTTVPDRLQDYSR
jgi:adenylate cyclase